MNNAYLTILTLALVSGMGAFLFSNHWQKKSWPLAHLDRRTTDLIVWILVLIYSITFSTLSTLRHLAFNTDGYDMGIFDQVVWNSLNGRLLETSILPDITLLLSQRFSPILLAFVPLYAVWSSPIVLMVAQTLGISIAAFPIYWFARARLGNGLAIAVVLAYLLCPALQGVNLFEFHEIALAIPLFSFAAFFMLRTQYVPMIVCLGLTLLVKEDMAFTVIAFGVYILFVHRNLRLGLAITLLSAIWGIVLLQYVIPFFNGSPLGTGNYYYFGAGIAAGRGRYDYLGHSFFEIITTVVTRPDFVLQHVLVPPKLDYILNLLTPLVFLPLVGAEISMVALPTLGISLLSDFAPQFSIDYHYSASLLPFLFFGLVVGCARLARQAHWGPRWTLSALLVVASVTGYYYLAPGPLAQRFDPSRYALTARTQLGQSLVSSILNEAVVVAQTGIVPHLSERRGIYEFPAIADYCQAEYLIADTTRPSYRQYEKEWAQWFASNYFERVTALEGYILARRKTPDRNVQIRFGDQMMLMAYTLPLTETVQGGQLLCPVVTWRAEQDLRTRYVVQAQLQDKQGHVYASDQHEPRAGTLPTNVWQRNRLVEDNFILRLSPTLPAGDYQIVINVLNPATGEFLFAHDTLNQNLNSEPVLTQLPIEKNKNNFTANQLQIEQPFFVDMAELRLLGYAPWVKETAVGTTLPVGLYWRARGKPQGDYQVAVQLLDPNGQMALEQVSRPANNTYPTTAWAIGEVLLDWHDLVIPENFPTGDYTLSVILSDTFTHAALGQTSAATVKIKPKD